MEDVRQQYDLLYNYSLHLTGSKWDAEDLAQEAIIRIHCKRKGNPMSHAYLQKVAKNLWIDRLRKKSEIVTDAVSESTHSSLSYENTLALAEQLALRLTMKQCQVFILKECFLYRTKEIAELLQTPETAVKASLHRARRRLEKQNETNDELKTTPHLSLFVQQLAHALWNNDPEPLLSMETKVARGGGTVLVSSTTGGHIVQLSKGRKKQNRLSSKSFCVCSSLLSMAS